MHRPNRGRRPESMELDLRPRGAGHPQRTSVEWRPEESAYRLAAEGVEYRVPVDPANPAGLLRMEGRIAPDAEWTPLLTAAGPLLREEEGAVLPPDASAARVSGRELQHSLRNRALSLQYAEEVDGRPVRRSVELRLTGRTLEIRVESPGGTAGVGWCGFALGPLGTTEARQVLVPGVPDPLLVLQPDGFLCAYADRWLGSASAYPPGGAFYRPDLSGQFRAVAETFYLTLSPDPLDPLPALRKSAAPYAGALCGRVTVDFFSNAPFVEDERYLRLLSLYGLRDVLLIYRNWQHFGYDRRTPVHYPANPERGENEAFRRMVGAAADNGWLVALREEYATVAGDSPYWSEKAVAHWPEGLPRETRRPGHFGIAADRMVEFARLEATKIRRNYRTSAVFVDGQTAWDPESHWRQVDAAPKSPAGTAAQAARHLHSLLEFLREVHGGPVVGAAGEGSARFDTFCAGAAEGVIRGVDGGSNGALIVDYELDEVRTRMVGIGAGSYRQFTGQPAGQQVDPEKVDWDAYRATAIALGHAGYVANYRLEPGPRGAPLPGGSARSAVREYYLMLRLQELYLGIPVRGVLYRDRDELVPLAEGLRRGLDFSQAQVRVEYANGLTVWVNRSRKERWPVEAGEVRHELPPSGFLALCPEREFTCYSSATPAGRADFCRAGDYTFVDVRSANPRRVEDLVLDGAAVLLRSEVHGRQDVVLVGARQLDVGEDQYRISERGDVRISHLSAFELEVVLLDTESGKPAHVAWPAFSPEWKAGKPRVEEWEEGRWQPSRCQLQPVRSGFQLARARPGVPYRVSVQES